MHLFTYWVSQILMSIRIVESAIDGEKEKTLDIEVEVAKN